MGNLPSSSRSVCSGKLPEQKSLSAHSAALGTLGLGAAAPGHPSAFKRASARPVARGGAPGGLCGRSRPLRRKGFLELCAGCGHAADTILTPPRGLSVSP